MVVGMHLCEQTFFLENGLSDYFRQHESCRGLFVVVRINALSARLDNQSSMHKG